MKIITEHQRLLINAVGAEGLSGLPAGVLEKDLLVTDALSSLAALTSFAFPIVFCGGTCLSKAHGLIQRMSEDLDFKVLVPESLSRSARSTQLREMKQRLVLHFSNLGFHVPAEGIIARDENNYFSLMLHFQSAFSAVVSLRPEIQVEFSARPVFLATQLLPIDSLLGGLTTAQTQAFKLSCVGVEESLAEKVLALLRRTAEVLNQSNPVAFDPRLVRHLYDVHQIVTTHPKLLTELQPGLFAKLVAGDAAQFANQHPAFADNPVAELTRALATIHADEALSLHYRHFVDDLVFGAPVAFSVALATFDTAASSLLKQLTSGFGLIKSRRKGVSVDFDAAKWMPRVEL